MKTLSELREEVERRVMIAVAEEAEAKRDAALFLREKAQIERDLAARWAAEIGRNGFKGFGGRGGL